MRKRLVNMLLYLVVTLILAGVASFVMTHFYGYKFIDALFWAGLITFLVGAMSSLKGTPTGRGINSHFQYFTTIETNRLERQSANYFANFKKQAVFDPEVSDLSIILTGVLLILISYFLS